ncbi:MAG TPA: hypothetical protein PK999_12800 [Nitrospira sp.]|nr:hypothetical protein [Nitrospira sp.]HNB63722.1 hypothetical protein [Rhodocyclaceae bacterium]HNC83922.1 hypothetical protein [Nitrospira sp.]HNI20161.1 hypothetical protein [Nitrospira sp.]
MFRSILRLALLCGTLSSPVAQSAALSCTGTLTDVANSAAGELRIKPSWRGDWITLCSTAVVLNGVQTEACKRWQAQALAAQLTAANTWVQYDNPVAPSCATMGTLGNADRPGYLVTY